MRVCYFGVYEPEYPRNAILRRGLQRAGVEVVECRAPVELGPSYMRGPGVQGFGLNRFRHEAGELRLTAARTLFLVRHYMQIRARIDAIILAEFNQGLAPLAAGLAAMSRVPLVVDFFVSLYDTVVNDRGLLKPTRPRARHRWAADTVALRVAQRVFVDSAPLAEYYARMFGLSILQKVGVVHVGAPEWKFQLSPLPERGSRPLNVLFYGNFIPLHGIEYIIRAARELSRDARFRFTIVGSGQTYPKIRAMYDHEPSHNVEFLPWQTPENLANLIRGADACLGIFGTSEKARRVVPNKTWQCLVSGRPVITGDGPGARSVFEDDLHCLLVPHGDPRGIVQALDRLARDHRLAERLAANGAKLVRDRYTSGPLGRQLLGVLEEVVRSDP